MISGRVSRRAGAGRLRRVRGNGWLVVVVAVVCTACLPMGWPSAPRAGGFAPLPSPPDGWTRDVGAAAFATPADWVVPLTGDLRQVGLPTAERLERAAASPDGTCLATTASATRLDPAPSDELPAFVTVNLDDDVRVTDVTPFDVPGLVDASHHVLSGSGQQVDVWGGWSEALATATYLVVACAEADLARRIAATWAPARPA